MATSQIGFAGGLMGIPALPASYMPRACTFTWTPAQVAQTAAPVQTVTVTGAQVGDAVLVCPPSATTGVALVSAWVSAADTLSVQFDNPTGGALTPPSGTYTAILFKAS